MHDLTKEELALLEADEQVQEKPARRGRKPGPKPGARLASTDERPDGPVDDEPAQQTEEPIDGRVEGGLGESSKEPQRQTEQAPAETPSPDRGPFTPAQYDDDGWGDTPAQMRG